MLEPEHAQRALAVPDQRVERRQQRGPVPAGHRASQGLGVGPGGQRGPVGTAGRDVHRDQPGRGRRLVRRQHLAVLLLARAAPAHPLVVDQVGLGGHAQRPARGGRQPDHALLVGGVGGQQLGRQHALGQVVHPAPAGPADAGDLAGVQQPLHGDLGVGPVPPGAALLGPAQLGGRQRALGPDPGQHRRADVGVALVPALAPGQQGAAPEAVVGPLLDGQHAGGMGPVLERVRQPRVPVSALDPLPADRAEAGVGDQLMRAGQHADGVQLDGAQPAQHGGHPATAAVGADQALGAQRQQPGLVGRQGELGRGKVRTGHERERNRPHRQY